MIFFFADSGAFWAKGVSPNVCIIAIFVPKTVS
jgi:hypothetical protein